MHHHHGRLARHDADIVPRQFPRRPDNVPRDRLSFLMGVEEPTLVKRAPSQSTTSASDSCATGANCTKSTSTFFTTTLPIVLGTLYVGLTTYLFPIVSNSWLMSNQYPSLVCHYSFNLLSSEECEEAPERRCQ